MRSWLSVPFGSCTKWYRKAGGRWLSCTSKRKPRPRPRRERYGRWSRTRRSTHPGGRGSTATTRRRARRTRPAWAPSRCCAPRYMGRHITSVEKILEVDEDRHLAYTVIGGIPVHNYRADVTLTPSAE